MTEAPRLQWPSWIGVVAADLQAQRHFYGAVLGLDEVDSGADWVQYDLGEGRMFEIVAVDPTSPEYDRPRVQTGFDVDDINSARAGLVEAGVEAITEVHDAAAPSRDWAYFRDPEGNVFEIKQKRPAN